MTEDALRKFNKETLVQFVFADSVFSRERTMEQLRHYEKRFRFQRLMAQSEKISAEQQNCKLPEESSRWNALVKKYQKIQREINKILGI